MSLCKIMKMDGDSLECKHLISTQGSNNAWNLEFEHSSNIKLLFIKM